MFDVGFTELLLIGVVALIVIGPERLPTVARTVGQYVGKLQRFVTGVKRDIRTELESGELKQLLGDQKQQIDELRKMVNTTRKDLESGTRDVMADAKKKFAEVESSAKGGEAAPKLTKGGEAAPKLTSGATSGAATPVSIAKERPPALPDTSSPAAPNADVSSASASVPRPVSSDDASPNWASAKVPSQPSGHGDAPDSRAGNG